MLLLAKSEDIAVYLTSSIQGEEMLVFSYLFWKDNRRFHNILLWIWTVHNVNRTICEIFLSSDFVQWRGPFRVTDGQTDYSIRSVSYDFLYVFSSRVRIDGGVGGGV